MLPEASQRHANRSRGAKPTPGTHASIALSGPAGGRAAPPRGPGLVHREQVARESLLLLENTAEARGRRRAARCHHRTVTRARLFAERVQRGGRRGRWLMVTFTYRDGVKWQASHTAEFWHRCRQWYRRQGVQLHYLWAMELTGRGRPHYHALIWIPRHLMLPTPDKRGWWPHGMTRTEVARNAVGYIAKYASKNLGGNPCNDEGLEYRFPRSARICGGSQLAADQGVEWRYWIAPRWARDLVPMCTDLRRAPGGGYFVPDTGELLSSPWRFLGVSPDGKHLQFMLRE